MVDNKLFQCFTKSLNKMNLSYSIINQMHIIINILSFTTLVCILIKQLCLFESMIIFHNKIVVIFFYTQNYQSGSYSHGIVLTSTYFPLESSKHGSTEYNEWMSRFFKIINCKTIFYTPKKFYDMMYENGIFKYTSKWFHLIDFNFTYNDIFEIPIMKNLKDSYKQIHEIDVEKKIHNPYLYAIWNSKIWFLREATLIYPNATFFFWIDSGCVRELIYESKFNKYGSFCNDSIDNKCDYLSFPKNNFVEDILEQSQKRTLDMCMFMVNFHKLKKYPKKKSNFDMFEGVFFGSKNGIIKFYNAFWEVHNKWLKNNIFCGKDQDIYNFVIQTYFKKIEFYIFPAYKVSKRTNGWFAFLSAFSKENPFLVSNKIYHISKYLKY